MSTKGTLTWVHKGWKGKLTKLTKNIMWIDGYDAWLCVFNGGSKNGWGHIEHKPTSYGFTLIVPTKTIKLSPKYDNEFARKTVRERTLGLHKFSAGQLICLGYTLTWLTSEEHKQLKEHYELGLTY